MNASVRFLNCEIEVKDEPFSDLASMIETQISTWSSHGALVGVKWKRTWGWRCSQRPFYDLWALRL